MVGKYDSCTYIVCMFENIELGIYVYVFMYTEYNSGPVETDIERMLDKSLYCKKKPKNKPTEGTYVFSQIYICNCSL